VIWHGRREQDHFSVEHGDDDAAPVALVGVRSCALRATVTQDGVLATRGCVAAHYAARRAGTFVVAVACADPAATCLCASMGTGPRPAATYPDTAKPAYDLFQIESLHDGEHHFIVEIGTRAGREVAGAAGATPATERDHDEAVAVTDAAAARHTRSINTDTIHDVLRASAESPQREEIAYRCLACTNCMFVCLMCLCTTVDDTSDLAGDNVEFHCVWDSCFSESFSCIDGGPLRADVQARYRQWMTHKLSSWEDKLGMLGCVGRGRCLAWCPVGIDIAATAAALGRMATAATAAPLPPNPSRASSDDPCDRLPNQSIRLVPSRPCDTTARFFSYRGDVHGGDIGESAFGPLVVHCDSRAGVALSGDLAVIGAAQEKQVKAGDAGKAGPGAEKRPSLTAGRRRCLWRARNSRHPHASPGYPSTNLANRPSSTNR
jgi:hypothetical protein